MPKKTQENIMEKIAKELANHTEILKNVTTKKDLENFATKKDLENFATKKDLENLVTRYDFNEVKQDISDVKTDLSEFKNETVIRLDKIIATQEKHEQERIFAYEQTRRHEEQIEGHTKEIKEIKEVLNIK